jgi:uncharacterized membrane protein
MDGPAARTPRSTRRLAIATLVSLVVALVGFWWLHGLLADVSDSGDGRPALIAAVGWTAAAAILASLATERPVLGLGLTALGLVLAWQLQAPLAHRIDLVYLAQHAGVHLVLGIAFLRTLRPGGGPPLITRLATRVHGTLPAPIARYTVHVTIGWTLYFFTMATVSVALFAFSTLETWSVLANLLTLPLIVLGFVLEYGLRRLLHPAFDHVSIFESIRAYRSPRP